MYLDIYIIYIYICVYVYIMYLYISGPKVATVHMF